MSEEVELMLLADVRSLEITLASKSRHLAEAQAKAAGFERDWYAAKSEFGTAMAKIREALRAAEKRELEALAELDEAIAEIERLRWGNEMACENTPVASCDCSGCMVARDRAERNITGPEGKRCACQWEAGDSPCPFHGEHDECA